MRPMAARSVRLAWRQLPRPRASHLRLDRPRPAATGAAPSPTSTLELASSQRAARRSYSSNSGPSKNRLVFWPIVGVVALSSAAYLALVKKREQVLPRRIEGVKMPPRALQPPDARPQLSAPAKDTPTFSPDDVTILFVLGGPGSGKGTQCARLVAEHGFVHLSAGDLLRAEQDRPESEFGGLIKQCIRDGAIVPMEVTVQLLENAIAESLDVDAERQTKKTKASKKTARFLIDGFPRKMDQALRFEEAVCPARQVLFFDCPEDEMQRRLLERGKTSGRADDNAESIKKRFRTFVETSMPVVDYFAKEGRVIKVDATPPPDAVYRETEKQLEAKLGKDF